MISAKLINNDRVVINKDDEKKEINIKDIDMGILYNSYICINENNDVNKKILLQKLNEKEYILVFSDEKNILYYKDTLKNIYKKMVSIPYKVIGIGLSRKKATIKILAYINNQYNLEISNQKLYIDQVYNKEIKLNVYKNKISKIKMLSCMNIISFDVRKIIKDASEINGSVRFTIEIEGNEIEYKIGMKNHEKNKRYLYAPIKSKYVNDFAIHFRRSKYGNLVFIKRKKENIENTTRFKILENKFLSSILYYQGRIFKKIKRKKINLFYEKFSEKAEEGTFDLFTQIRDNSKTKSYYVIDKNVKDYIKIKKEKNVVVKYSVKYYWLIYNSSNFISTEVPGHLNILRSNNKYLRKALIDGKLIFLQHGVTYLKCQGKNSPFSKGKEGEATYVVVGSEKEKNVIREAIGIDEDKIIKSGLPIFDKIQYKHINQKSENIVTVMLTWKPYEEQLYNFKESSYYKNVLEIYNLLKKYIDKEKIKIVAHPKVYTLLISTDLKESLWDKPISEVLRITKLLITDYSSVCYNAFYQGAGVIFYQPDLEKYEIENGKLIPANSEYIGYRTFDIEKLENRVKEAIKDKIIDLSYIRNSAFESNYKEINEFCDGKNIYRIYEKLKELYLI